MTVRRCTHAIEAAIRLAVPALLAWPSLAAGSGAGGANPLETYTQEIEVVFKNGAHAARATPRVLGLYDGAVWAVAARWDDNNLRADLAMREAMNARGYKATFYLTKTNKGMGPAQLKQLLSGGNSIAGHSLTHGWMPYQNRNRIFEEMAGIRLDLEAASDSPVVSFGFPFLATNDKKRAPKLGGEMGRLLERAGIYHVAEREWQKWTLGQSLLYSPWLPPDGGDVTGDARKWPNEQERKKTYPVMSFAMHAGAFSNPAKMAKLQGWLQTYGGNPEWWYCNQNQYAAYRYQFLHSRVQRLPARGNAARFRITRPVLLDLGDPVPLTVELAGVPAGAVARVTSQKAKCEVSSKTSACMVHIGHDADQHHPRHIGLVHNRDNSPSPGSARDGDFGDLAAHLHYANDKLALAIDNRGAPLANVKITYRLPLQFREGVVRHSIERMGRGRQRDELSCAPSTDDYIYRAGSAFFVAQIDFARGDEFGRLYATCNVDTAEPDPAFPQGNFMRLGPIPEARFDLAKVAAAARSPTGMADAGALGAQGSAWGKTEGALAAPWLDPEIVRTEGRWYSRKTGAYFLLRSTVVSPGPQAVKVQRKKETVPHVYLNGTEVNGGAQLRRGENALVLVYKLPGRSTHPERGGCFFRLTDAGGSRRLENIRYVAK